MVDMQRGDYEELDQLSAAHGPIAKAAYRDARAAGHRTRRRPRYRTAASGRPGGVYLDMPARCARRGDGRAAGGQHHLAGRRPGSASATCARSGRSSADLLAQAKRPLIILGKGAAYAQADKDIRTFVESTGIPYLPMSMAKGLLPDNHPQSAAAARSLALARADVVMLVGARLNWLLGTRRVAAVVSDAQFIQVDIAPTEIDSNRPIAAPLVGDIGSAMARLLGGSANQGTIRAHRVDWTSSPIAQEPATNATHAARLDADPTR